MSEQSPVEAYWQACRVYEEIQSDRWDSPSYLQELRAQQVVIELCFQRLLSVADSEDPTVWHALGNAFSSRIGGQRDKAQAIRWYQRAAEAGYSPSMVSLAFRLLHPEPSRDSAEGISWLRKAAGKGDSKGMVFLGFAYRDGSGVPCDPSRALHWFTKAVEAGDAHSMIYVGRIYSELLSSPAQAQAWFLRAAEAGQPESFLRLAFLYDDRESELYDPREAHKWYRVDAEYTEGLSSTAQLRIAEQYAQGRGVPCDLKMARLWLRRLLQAARYESSGCRRAARMLKKLEGQFL